MPDAFRATIMSDDINVVTDSLTVADVVALAFSIAAGFKDRFVGTLWQACPAGNALIGDQKRHGLCLLLSFFNDG